MNRIRQIRKIKHISQEELSRLLDIGQATVSKWETGRANPSTANAVLMAKLLDVPLNYLMGITDDPADEEKAPESEADSDAGIKFALFGDADAEISAETLQDIREYAAFKMSQEKRRR